MKKTKPTLTKSEFAKAQGISPSLVSRLVQRGLPVEKGGQIDPARAEKWLAQHRSDSADRGRMDSFAAAQTRKERALAGLRELELAMKSGEAISIKDATEAWAAMIGAARAKMLGLGAALGQEVALNSDPGECCRVIDSAVKEALIELSKYNPELKFSDNCNSGEEQPE